MSDHKPEEVILPLIVRAQAQRRPDAVYLENAERRYSYAEAHAEGLRWARAFLAAGVAPGDRVLVMLPVGVESVFAWLGLGWVGAVETPINYEYKGKLLDYVIGDSGATLLVTHAQYLDQIRTAETGLAALRTIVLIDEGATDGGATDGGALAGTPLTTLSAFLDAPGAPEPDFTPQPGDLGTIMYTSGTTGASKGVMVPWAQVWATSRWTIPLDGLDETDAYYNPYPLFHIAGKLSIYTMAMVGGRAVLRERFSTTEFWRDVNRFGCTVAILLGAVANFLYRQPETPEDADNSLKKVLMVPLIPDVETFKRRFGLQVCTCWNMTETSSPIISPGFDLVDAASCGRARPGAQCRLVDEQDNPVPPGVEGELVVRADDPWTMMAGYLGKPEKTVEATRNLWLHTGDVFRQDEAGNFYYIDRKKDMIRRRGENISSLEVELEVNAFDAVLESAAYGVPSEWGEEEVMVAIVPKPGRMVDLAELHAFLKARMPKFMTPQHLRLLDEMPKTPTAKIRKTDLRAQGVTPDAASF